MAHVGGRLQAAFMARVKGRDLAPCLVVPVDVGKSMAMALVAEHFGEVMVAPFEFELTETGFASLTAAQAPPACLGRAHQRRRRSLAPCS